MADKENEDERNVSRARKETRPSEMTDKSDRQRAHASGEATGSERLKAAGSRKQRGKKKKQRKRRRNEFDRFLRFIEEIECEESDLSAQTTFSVLGSVPAFATSETMIAQSQAQGMMMANQVANQQKVNTIAMATTAACVSDLLQIHLHWPHHDRRHHHHHDDGPPEGEEDDY